MLQSSHQSVASLCSLWLCPVAVLAPFLKPPYHQRLLWLYNIPDLILDLKYTLIFIILYKKNISHVNEPPFFWFYVYRLFVMFLSWVLILGQAYFLYLGIFPYVSTNYMPKLWNSGVNQLFCSFSRIRLLSSLSKDWQGNKLESNIDFFPYAL